MLPATEVMNLSVLKWGSRWHKIIFAILCLLCHLNLLLYFSEFSLYLSSTVYSRFHSLLATISADRGSLHGAVTQTLIPYESEPRSPCLSQAMAVVLVPSLSELGNAVNQEIPQWTAWVPNILFLPAFDVKQHLYFYLVPEWWHLSLCTIFFFHENPKATVVVLI